MKAGTLDKRVEVQAPIKTLSEHGQAILSWITTGVRWASVEPLTSREFWNAQQVQADISHKITMRWFPGLTTEHRLKMGERIFHIGPPQNVGEKNETWLIMAREVAEVVSHAG